MSCARWCKPGPQHRATRSKAMRRPTKFSSCALSGSPWGHPTRCPLAWSSEGARVDEEERRPASGVSRALRGPSRSHGHRRRDDGTQRGVHGLGVRARRDAHARDRAAHGKQAPPASSTDISEALVLIERGKAAAAQQWALLSGDAVETNAALRSIFTNDGRGGRAARDVPDTRQGLRWRLRGARPPRGEAPQEQGDPDR